MLLSAFLCGDHDPECLRDLPLNLDPGLSEIIILPELGRALATFSSYDKMHSRNNLRRDTFWLMVSQSVIMERGYQSNSDHDSGSERQRLLTAWWIRRREWVRLVLQVVIASRIHHFKSRIG